MLKKFLFLICLIGIPLYADAESGVYSVDALFQRNADNTECATKIFNKALADTAHMVALPDEAATTEIDTWAHFAFSQPEVLRNVLNCPELKNADNEDTIVFDTVSYTFPNGREIKINYETQKNVLKQRLLLSTKKSLPGNTNPDIAQDVANGNIWINVDPAWYAIAVAEHGTLDKFVGPDKNNIVSVNYIQEHVSDFYPKDHSGPFRADCTSRSAYAGDTDMINRAATITFGGPPPHADKTDAPTTKEEKAQAKEAKRNDYYVMGQANLQWVAALELTADIVLTIVTDGIYIAAKGAIQGARATRAFAKSAKMLKSLKGSKDVSKWLKSSKNMTHIERALKTTDKIDDSYDAVSKLNHASNQNVKSLASNLDALKKQKGANAKAIKTMEQELELATKQANAAKQATTTAEKIKNAEKTLQNTTDATEIKKLEQEIANLKKTYTNELNEVKKLHATELETLGNAKDVKAYQEIAEANRDVAHTAYLLRQSKLALKADRGLLPVRAYRAGKALRAGLKASKNTKKAAKTIRANMSGVSARINDWLFHSTLQNLQPVAAIPAALQTLKVIAKIAGDMYDFTETHTGEFTNNVDMKPYLLLGADNLKGYEDVVNEGMWLFWAGSSTSAADDDAAFLQAMSFAEKFHQDLVDVQDYYNVMACDVDIYVVRPIIRNPGKPDAELYYLFMNETPWTTNGYNEPNDGTGETNLPTDENDSTTDADILNSLETTNTNEPANTTDTPDASNNAASSYTPADGNGTVHYLKGIGTVTEPSYNGNRVGQPCTKPSALAGGFTKEVLTTGRYASKSPAFEKAMITKFRTEGTCGNHPDDPGGYTCYGVSSKFFPEARKPEFSRADAEDIAWNHFFKKYNIDKLPDAISGDVFMALWGTGSKMHSIGLLQELLGIEKTGVVDEQTIQAAKNYHGDLRTKFLDARAERFKQGNKTFRQGWLNGLDVYRANGCHTIAQDTVP